MLHVSVKKTSTLMRVLVGVVSLFLLLLCVGCSMGADDGKLHDGYYREIAMTANGEFIPKGKLSDSEVQKAGLVYKVEMDKEKKDQVKKITTEYQGKSTRTAVWKTTEGLWQGRFASVVVTLQDNGFVQYAFFDASGEKCTGYFNAYSIRFKKDEKTNEVKAAYLYNKDGENQIGKDKQTGISQLLFSYDSEKRLNKIGMANQDGNAVKATTLYGGNATALQIEYDKEKKDRISSISWVNDGGNLVKGPYWAKETFSYDEKGRLIEKAHFGVDDNPVDVKVSSGLTAIYSLTAPGDMLKGLMEAKEGFITGGAVTRYTYDKDATAPSKVAFFGKSGQSFGMEGTAIAEIDLTYDSAGNVSKIATCGADGNAKAFSGNIDAVALEYDERGSIAKETFYHGDNATSLQMGKFQGYSVAEIDYTYDEHGWVASESYYDASGAPTDLKLYGALAYQKTTFTWKDDGSVDKTTMYAQDGTEIEADAMSVVCGKYKMVNPSNDMQRWSVFEITPTKVTFMMDADKISLFEQRTHQKYKPSTQATTVKASLNQQTGKGTLTLLGETCSYDAVTGIFTEPGGSKWKKMDK